MLTHCPDCQHDVFNIQVPQEILHGKIIISDQPKFAVFQPNKC